MQQKGIVLDLEHGRRRCFGMSVSTSLGGVQVPLRFKDTDAIGPVSAPLYFSTPLLVQLNTWLACRTEANPQLKHRHRMT